MVTTRIAEYRTSGNDLIDGCIPGISKAKYTFEHFLTFLKLTSLVDFHWTHPLMTDIQGSRRIKSAVDL